MSDDARKPLPAFLLPSTPTLVETARLLERERVLNAFSLLSYKWHQTALGIDCCECSTDHYDCGNEIDALVRELRGGPLPTKTTEFAEGNPSEQKRRR
jgi:hypothetical protein